ncbi:unnamed protein product [Caenorhabditis brenneri]
MDQNHLGQLFPALQLTPELIERLLNNNRTAPIVQPAASIPLIEILRRQVSMESSDEHRIGEGPQQRHASEDSSNPLNLGIGIGVGHQFSTNQNSGLSPDAIARALANFNGFAAPILPASAALQPIVLPMPGQSSGGLDGVPSGNVLTNAQHPLWGIMQNLINLIGMAIGQQDPSGNLLGVPASTSQQFGLGQGSTQQSSNSTSELPSPLLGGLGLHTSSEVSTSHVANQLITTATNTESDGELEATRIMLETIRGQLGMAIQQNRDLIQENHCLQDNSRDLRQDMEDLARENHLLEQDHFHSLANYQDLMEEYQSQEARLRAANATLKARNEKLKQVTSTAKAVRVGALRIQLADQDKRITELSKVNGELGNELYAERDKNKALNEEIEAIREKINGFIMAQRMKMDTQNLSNQALFNNFQECLQEMINRGMSVYYCPPGASREDHLQSRRLRNFPVTSIKSMVVLNSENHKTDANLPAGGNTHDKDGSASQDGHTNIDKEIIILDSYTGYNAQQSHSAHIPNPDISHYQEAEPIVAHVAPAAINYGTFTPEEPSFPQTSHSPNSPVPTDKDENWNGAVIATESVLKRYLVLPQFAEGVPNGKQIQRFLGTKEIGESLQFCNNLSRFLRDTRKILVNEGVLVPAASGANGLNTAHQEALPIAAQPALATVDYGTFRNTTSHHPNSPVRTFPSPPQSKEEKWADAVEFTATEMNNNPYCKFFTQCFFNPDGPKYKLPQIVKPVPFPSLIRDFLKDKDKEFCEKLYSRLRTEQAYMMDRGFVRLGRLSSLGRKRSASPVAPPYDAVQNMQLGWKSNREKRRAI